MGPGKKTTKQTSVYLECKTDMLPLTLTCRDLRPATKCVQVVVVVMAAAYHRMRLSGLSVPQTEHPPVFEWGPKCCRYGPSGGFCCAVIHPVSILDHDGVATVQSVAFYGAKEMEGSAARGSKAELPRCNIPVRAF